MATHSGMLRESHGRRSLLGYSSWGRRESDTAAVTEHAVDSCCGLIISSLLPGLFYYLFHQSPKLNFLYF